MRSHPPMMARIAVSALPLACLCAWLLVTSSWIAPLKWTIGLGVGIWWLAAAWLFAERVQRPARTLASLVRALREGDYSIRAREPRALAGPMAEALHATNELAELLDRHRLEVVDATTLVQRIMDEIDVAVFGVDDEGYIALCNDVGEAMFEIGGMRGRAVVGLEVEAWLTGESPRIIELPGQLQRRWQLRRARLRQGGRPFTLVILSDLSKVLDEEARRSAYNVVRVLSHEINNSLTPIASIAEALADRLSKTGALEQEKVRSRLGMIAERARNLEGFLGAYAELARLPPPVLAPLEVSAWVHRVAALETRIEVRVVAGPALVIAADPSQLDRALINLVSNAVDASLQTAGSVSVDWREHERWLEVRVRDGGSGLLDRGNLFVPFYTTKPKGAGIGLTLSREIARAHGGDLQLHNRDDGPGCEAVLTLAKTATDVDSSGKGGMASSSGHVAGSAAPRPNDSEKGCGAFDGPQETQRS